MFVSASSNDSNVSSGLLMFQISFFSTSTELSNRDRYPFFLRTIPSDVNQAQAMVELVRMFHWTYVSVVYEESSYGIQVRLCHWTINKQSNRNTPCTMYLKFEWYEMLRQLHVPNERFLYNQAWLYMYNSTTTALT